MLMFIAVILEVLGIGMIIPILAFMADPDIMEKNVALSSFLISIGSPSRMQIIVTTMLVLSFIYLIKVLFLVYLSWKKANFVYRTQEKLSYKLYSTYLHQPYTFHLQHNSGQLVNTVHSEVAEASFSLLHLINLMIESFVVIGILILLIFLEPLGAFSMLAIFGLAGYLFYSYIKTRLEYWGGERYFHSGMCVQHLQQGLGGIKDVKLLGLEQGFLAQFLPHNKGKVEMSMRQNIVESLPRLWFELLAVIGLSVLVGVMAWQNKVASEMIPIIGVFAAAAFRLIPSSTQILNNLQSIKFSRVVVKRINSELKLDLSHDRGTIASFPFKHSIELSQVYYSYSSSNEHALRDINLSIQKNTTVGFIGTSGSGKTTLIDIILGLLSPQSGGIKIDGRNIQTNLRGWQNKIGYVPQSIFLIDASLRQNIAFGIDSEKINEAQVQSAAKFAQLDEFVEKLPDGLDTIVGERGVRLSGGQKQRIGIARALYHNPEIIVLDEATSAIDNATERDVMRPINQLKNKTILIIAHRLDSLRNCDTVFRLENGVIVEQVDPIDL